MNRKIFIIILLFISIFTFYGCKKENKHEHAYSNDWTYNEESHWHQATCEHHDEISNKEDHDYEVVVTSPTCLDEGYTTYTCKVCGYSYKDNYVEATGHSYASVWSSDDDYHYHAATCEHIEEVSDKGSHDWVDTGVIITVATESIEGEKEQRCSVCGKIRIVKTGVLGHEHTYDTTKWSYNEEYHYHAATCAHTSEMIDKANHDYEVVVTDPTCLDQGYTTYTCKVCGYSYISDYVEATGHSYASVWSSDDDYHYHAATCEHIEEVSDKEAHNWVDTGVIITVATETVEGEKEQKCSICGKTRIVKTGCLEHVHTFDTNNWSYNETYHYHAATCAHTSEMIDKANHDYEVVVTAPTCLDQGYTTHTCKVCGYSYIDNYVEATGHSYASDWTKDETYHWHIATCEHSAEVSGKAAHDYEVVVTAPTCLEQGYTTHTCKVCGYSYKDNYTDATGHSYASEWTKDETYHWHIATCEHSAEVSGKAAHDYEVVVTNPTCLDQGYTTHTCKVCGYSYIDNYVEATGHSYASDWTKDETYHWHVATCEHTTEVSGKVAHDYEVVVTAPTCLNQGYTTYTCKICGYTYVGNYVEATGHSYASDWTKDETYHWHVATCEHSAEVSGKAAHDYEVVVTAPTCLEQGYTTHTCKVCGYSYIDNYVEATGHSYGSTWSYDENYHYYAATCGHDLVIDQEEHTLNLVGKCTVCGYQKPIVNIYYLPSVVTEYNGYDDKITNVITYEYDEDLLGYTKTRLVDNYEKEKEIETYRYSEDFSTCTYVIARYRYSNEENDYYLWEMEKYEYEFLENDSYKYKKYDYNTETEEYEFYREVCKMYNENGQLLLEYDKRDNPYIEGEYYYNDYYTYEYDEFGYPIRENYYTTDDTLELNIYIYIYSEYTYNEDYSHCIMEEYYLYDEGFERISWTDISIVNEDGIRKFDEQIYYEDETLGNHNIHYYNEDFISIYNYYGGMSEEEGLTLNNNKQVIGYYIDDPSYKENLEVIYNEKSDISKSILLYENDLSTVTKTSIYTYDENNQIIKVEQTVEYDDVDLESGKFVNELNATYKEFQNDFLYVRMKYLEEIIESYSHWAILDGEIIY